VSSSDIDEVGAKPGEFADMLRDVAYGAQLIPFVDS
jgi:hypothetical protein